MPKVQLNVNEIVSADVNLVSMVKRGANRLPFRITKGDTEEMLDLYKIGRNLFQKAEIVPAVVAVIVSKSADIAAISTALAAAGIDTATMKKSEQDTSVSFAKSDTMPDEKESFVLKVSDEVALVIEAPQELAKSVVGYDWESTSFSEVMSKGSFAPSLCLAQDMLQRTFFNIMEEAGDGKELTKMMKSAIGEFESYITSLTAALPKSVFKADTALSGLKKAETVAAPVAKTEEAKPEGETTETKKEEISANPVNGNETDSGATPPNGGNDIDGNPVNGNETKKNPPTKPGVGEAAASNDVEGAPAAGLKKDDEDLMAKLLDSVGTLLKTQMEELKAHVNESVATVKTDVSTVSASVAELASKVKKTDEAINGVVSLSPERDRLGVQKSDDEGDGAPPPLDTAYTKVESLQRRA